LSANHDIITATTTVKLGKIVKIKISYKRESQIIDSINITGDFFMHPEETIEHLEQGLVGVKLEKEELKNKIQSLLKDSEFYGFDIDSLTNIILDTKGD
jgi:predicted nucleic-acid-binding protein